MNVNDAEKIYDKLKPYKVTTLADVPSASGSVATVVQKRHAFSTKLREHGYLWDSHPVEPEEHVPKEGVEEHKAYGLHTYGGYYGFFRPDLWEVITLFAMLDISKRIDEMEAIYCTTEPNGSGDISDVYDNSTDCHRGITTFLIKWA